MSRRAGADDLAAHVGDGPRARLHDHWGGGVRRADAERLGQRRFAAQQDDHGVEDNRARGGRSPEPDVFPERCM